MVRSGGGLGSLLCGVIWCGLEWGGSVLCGVAGGGVYLILPQIRAPSLKHTFQVVAAAPALGAGPTPQRCVTLTSQ